MRKAIWCVAWSVGVACVWGCGSCGKGYCVTQAEPASTARAGSNDHVRVMSFNIRTRNPFDLGNGWGFRRDALTQTIRRFGPDVLGTQECRASQADDLRKALPEYGFVGAGRSDGDEGGEMCAIFFRSDKYSKLDEGHFWLSDTPREEGSKDWGMFPRMVSWVKLTPHTAYEPFHVFNTHFDLNQNSQVRSATLLQDQVRRIAGTGPVIVTGDFNTGEGTTPYNLLVAGHKGGTGTLVDTYRIADPTYDTPEGTRHKFRGSSDGERIDLILASPQFTTLTANIVRDRHNGRMPSDHFPVTAVLRISDKPVVAVAARTTPPPYRPTSAVAGKAGYNNAFAAGLR